MLQAAPGQVPGGPQGQGLARALYGGQRGSTCFPLNLTLCRAPSLLPPYPAPPHSLAGLSCLCWGPELILWSWEAPGWWGKLERAPVGN